ncbi:TIGR03757 family integrating conjugative element protein [Azotobacter bryophylli]|uniref:TIGR03757 family integrating conjugative element protein n=1 Tax=Azotobacter bryophylli TaxID=1986537 RepID=A0ABV7AWP0_9GAMM
MPLLLLIQASTVASARAEAWAITDSAHPLSLPPGVRLIQLDAGERLEAKLSAGLPTDPAQAALALRQRLQGSDGARWGQELATAQQGLVEAWSVGVQKLPAVVVDRRYVVYGETDVNQALARIDEYRQREGRP